MRQICVICTDYRIQFFLVQNLDCLHTEFDLIFPLAHNTRCPNSSDYSYFDGWWGFVPVDNIIWGKCIPGYSELNPEVSCCPVSVLVPLQNPRLTEKWSGEVGQW